MVIKLIDIHTHIIPNVDDGPESLEESLKLITMMVNGGVTDIIATPHFQSVATKTTPEEQYEGFLKLKEAVKEKEIDINLHFGHEVRFISHLRPDYKKLTLANSKYILIEFSYINNPMLEEVIFNLRALGLKPILAHIERYRYLKEEDVIYLKRMGALMQVNAETIYEPASRKEKKFINSLIKKELIDFIASDVHNTRERQSNLRRSYDILSDRVSKKYLKKLFYSNAKKILENK